MNEEEILRFAINFTTNDDGKTIEADKTYAELVEAIENQEIIDAYLTYEFDNCDPVGFNLKFKNKESTGEVVFVVLASAEEVINDNKVIMTSSGISISRPGGGGGTGGGVVDCHFYKEGASSPVVTSTYTPSEVEDLMKQGTIVNGYLHSDTPDDVKFLGSAWAFRMIMFSSGELIDFRGVGFGFGMVMDNDNGTFQAVPEVGTHQTDGTKFMLYGG